MTAMILAAGLGTRLQPITLYRPKALVEINGQTLLETAITKIKESGINRIVINVHHFAEMIIEYVRSKNSFGIEVLFSDETQQLLDTGGALLKAADMLKSTKNILIYNVDIISDINLNSFFEEHLNNNALATLAVNKRPADRNLLFDDNNYLCAWQNTKTNERKIGINTDAQLKPFSFMGIHIISNKIFELINETGKFSVIDLYLRLAKNHKISAFLDETAWKDMGDITKL